MGIGGNSHAEAEIMNAWTNALKAYDGKAVANVKEDIEIENVELELHRERADTME